MTGRDQIISDGFEAIDRVCDNYVLLRGFDEVACQSHGGQDIDMLISRKDLDAVTSALASNKFNISVDPAPYRYLYGAKPRVHCRHADFDIMFDLHTSLFYNSIGHDNVCVNVDEAVLDSMFNNRVKTDNCWKYEPSKEDYIVHLCCRVIFDKRGCDEKYTSWIQEAYKDCDEKKVRDLCTLIFYSATDRIVECISNNQSQHLFKTYITSSQY